MAEPAVDDAARQWWATAVTRIEPNVITLRGIPIQDVITEEFSYAEIVYLMMTGRRSTAWESRLLNAALVASVDHGTTAPSIAAARMAITCGVGVNSAVATGIGLLGDTHGGAGQQCSEMLQAFATEVDRGGSAPEIAAGVLADFRRRHARIPGFGHRFHTRDPRRDPLVSLCRTAVNAGAIAGRYLGAALALEQAFVTSDRPQPINIDGCTAVIHCELGLTPEMSRGLFCLSRGVGILAHVCEEANSGRRIKGPLPPSVIPPYIGDVSTPGPSR